MVRQAHHDITDKVILSLSNDTPSYKWENFFRSLGLLNVAGVDEAGRGALAGPVVAGAVILPKGCKIENLNDSKQLTSKEREEIFLIIQQEAIAWSVGIVDQNAIDQTNILKASLSAMKIAVTKLSTAPDLLLVDGNIKIPIETPQKTIVRGDSLSYSIAAGSIVAKVTRDKMMVDFDSQFPGYDFKTNKGYGTAKHIKQILNCGASPIHRQSFDPIKSLKKS